jgi:hypothetical protein
MPEDLYKKLVETAEELDTSVADLLRRFIKLGLIVLEVQKAGGALLLREDDKSGPKEIVIL